MNREPDISAAARIMGRKGGLVGGKARWAGLTAEQRSEVLRRASMVRWAKHKKGKTADGQE